MDVRAEIEGLVEDGGRRAGSDAERRAAGRVEERLGEMGREVEVESIDIYPRWAVVHLIHAFVAVIGSLISVAIPAVGFGLVLLATLSAFGDASGLFRPLRRLTGRRASQNVFSPEGEDSDGRIVLVAHVDSARGGILFARGLQERLAVLGGRIKRPIGPFIPFMATLLVLLVCCFVRLLGQKGNRPDRRPAAPHHRADRGHRGAARRRGLRSGARARTTTPPAWPPCSAWPSASAASSSTSPSGC